MTIRIAAPSDAHAIAAIYAPIVRDTTISFELEPPSTEDMRGRRDGQKQLSQPTGDPASPRARD